MIFNTEFGRTPYAESAGDKAGAGRDHNADAFSVWLAGAGLKHGIAYGTSDEIGWKAAENPVDVHDFHATILHLLGIDHTRLTFYHNGIQPPADQRPRPRADRPAGLIAASPPHQGLGAPIIDSVRSEPISKLAEGAGNLAAGESQQNGKQQEPAHGRSPGFVKVMSGAKNSRESD